VTLGLYLVGALRPFRAILLFFAQIAGGVAGSGLLAVLTPTHAVSEVVTTLQSGVNKGQGLMIEAFLTAMLVFCVLMLAAESERHHSVPLRRGADDCASRASCYIHGPNWHRSNTLCLSIDGNPLDWMRHEPSSGLWT